MVNQTKEYICEPNLFFTKTNSHIQDETLYNGRMLKELCCYSLFLVLILKFLTKYGNINSIYHSDKMICQFP